MGKQRREWLTDLRNRRGHSQNSLAELVGVDGGTVGRWERGEQDIRSLNWARLAEAFGLSVRQLSDIAVAAGEQLDAPGRTRERVTTVRPRPLISPLDALRSTVDGYRGLDHSVGPVGTLDAVRAQLVVAGRVIEESRTDKQRRQALALAAEIHQLVGWMSFDLGDLDGARIAFDRARATAAEADEPALLAYVLGPSHAFAEADAGDPAHALDLAYASLGWARRSGNKRLQAFALAISARVHAKLGDESPTRAALDEATQLLSIHDEWDADPMWLEVFDETALLGHTGSCDLDLGRPNEAVELLERQDATSPDIFVRNRAIWRLDRATAFRQLGEIEPAVDEIDQALDLIDATSSARTRHKLTDTIQAVALSTMGSAARERLSELLNRSRPPEPEASATSEADESTDS